MKSMEVDSKINNTTPLKKTTEVSDFIKAEQCNTSEPLNNCNIDLVDNEKSDKEEISQTVNVNESKEPMYQDILGSGDLLKKIIKQGTLDERPMKGEQIVINLVGRLEDNNDIIEEEKNFEITLGDCEVILLSRMFMIIFLNNNFNFFQVIQGVDLSLSLMNVGEIASLKIASRFGYGDIGLEPNVPGGAKLIYIIELLSIKPEIAIDELTPIERLKFGFVYLYYYLYFNGAMEKEIG